MKLSFSLLSALLLISCIALSNGASIQISREEINTSALIQDIIDHGVDFCFQKAADQYGISDSNIEVTQINSVFKLESRHSTIYKCDVEATNNDGETLKARFDIEFDLDTEEQIVRKWGYGLVVDDDNSQPNQEHDTEAGSSDNNTDISNDHSDTETEVVVEADLGIEDPDQENEFEIAGWDVEVQITETIVGSH